MRHIHLATKIRINQVLFQQPGGMGPLYVLILLFTEKSQNFYLKNSSTTLAREKKMHEFGILRNFLIWCINN